MKKILLILVGVLFVAPAANAQECSYFSFCGQELVVYAKGPVYDYHPSQRNPQAAYYPYASNYMMPQYQYMPQQYGYNPYMQYGYNPYMQFAPVSASWPQQYGPSPVPMGTTNLLGQQLCDWGGGYRGYDCNGGHPAQPLRDFATGQWY